MGRNTLSPELRAELSMLYRQWLAVKRKRKASKVRRARERWLNTLAAVAERRRARWSPLVMLLGALTDTLRTLEGRP